MGKGKPSKKDVKNHKKASDQRSQKKRDRANSTELVADWLTKNAVTTEDLMVAGLGVAARSAQKGKRKQFKRALKSGRRLELEHLPMFDKLVFNNPEQNEEPDARQPTSADPVISYQHNGGGWYAIEVAGVEVERVQGEHPAAERAGSLLAAYAALDSKSQQSRSTGVDHVGGGWYEVKVSGVPVDRVRGKTAVAERYPQLVQ